MMQQMFLGQGPSGVNVSDVFNVTHYNGNGAARSITTNIDLQNNDGLLWFKSLTGNYNHQLYDTLNGVTKKLMSDSAAALGNSDPQALTSFNSNGFSVNYSVLVNQNGGQHIAYSFQKAAKFFDVITYSGNNTNGRTISHNLGVTPGCIFIKNLSAGNNWMVQHVGSSNGSYLNNDKTFNQSGNGLNATATDFTVSSYVEVNGSNNDYIAYVWAEDTPDLIKCGSYSGTGVSGNTINVGFQPQYVWIKAESTTGGWYCVSSAVSRTVVFNTPYSSSSVVYINLVSNGFQLNTTSNAYNGNNQNYVYMAIAAP